MNRLWITWESQRRNIGLAESFSAEYVALQSSSNRTIRYLDCGRRTLKLLLHNQYRVVFCQCPSLLLALICALVKRSRPFCLVVDAHNATFEYAERNPVLRLIVRYVFQQADFVIVSNPFLVKQVAALGGRAIILPDRLPVIEPLPVPSRFDSHGKPRITLISSFASDEPTETFLEAARTFGSKCVFYVTGRISRAEALKRFESPWIRFTNYLSPGEFDSVIQHSDLLVDLTTREGCLVCGAYEALAAGVPAILSKTDALMQTFERGFLFADNTVQGLQDAIASFLENSAQLKTEIREYRPDFEERWKLAFSRATQQLAL